MKHIVLIGYLIISLLNNLYSQNVMQTKYFSKKQAEKILSQNPDAVKLVKKVCRELDAEEVYLFKNGTHLIFLRDKAYLMTWDEYIAFSKEKEKDFLSTPDEIMAKKEVHLANFFDFFGRKGLDFSVESIKKVDNKYLKLDKEGISEAEIFLPVVIYVGEVLVHETKGKWTITHDKLNREELAIIDETDKIFDPYYCIKRILSRTHRKYSFYSAIYTQLFPLKFDTFKERIDIRDVDLD
jgi:hypothetical protein